MVFKRFVFMVVGVALLGASVAFLRIAAFGIDPFTSMTMSLSEAFGIDFGTFQLLFNLALLVVVVIFARKYIGLGTLVNMAAVGYVIDFVRWLLAAYSPGFWGRAGFFAVGLLLMCFSCALYMSADMGYSPYDAQAYILREHSRFSFRVLRIGTDSLCTLTAALTLLLTGGDLAALVGVGTLVTALFTGPLVQFFRSKCTDPWLETGRERAT